jgi:hypothetical protein
MSNTTRHFSPTERVGDYVAKSGTFTPQSSGVANAMMWDGADTSTLMLTGTNTGTGWSIGSETIDGTSYRTLSNMSLYSIQMGDYEKSGENFFYAVVARINTTTVNKGFVKCGNTTNGHELAFDGSGNPIVTFYNSSVASLSTGSFVPTVNQVQVHVVQRFGSSLKWSIDGVVCLDAKTSSVGGSGSDTGSLFRRSDTSSPNFPDCELVEFFRSDMTATTEIDRLKTEGYLCDKYGIKLPADHRYKNGPPTA